MKKITILLMLILLTACSGGGSSTTPTDPTISNFSILPATGIGGTTVTMALWFDYTSTNGLSNATYTGSKGNALVVDARACASGSFSCVVEVVLVLDTEKGTSLVKLSVVDASGNISNTIYADFIIT